MSHCSALMLVLVCGNAMGGDVVRLPSLGGTSCQAWDINDHGQIVGTSEVAGDANAHGVLWMNGTPTDLGVWGTPGDYHSHAEAINNLGQIVGYSEVAASGDREALFWDSDLTMRNLGQEMGALGNSVCWDINDVGLVCGQAPLSAGFAKGFVWDEVNGGRTEGTVLGYMGGSNKGLNNAGVLVGHGFFFGDPDTAMLASPDGRGGWDEFEIGPGGFNLSIATAVNDAGQVAGFTNAGAPGPWTACLYTQEAPGFVSLGTLPLLENSESYDINEAGVVVGSAWDDDFLLNPRAWAYVDGEMHDLNDLLIERGDSEFVQLFVATGINEHNDIVGYGETTDGALAGFLIEGFMADRCVADLAEPFGVLDFSDVTAFLAAFSAGEPEADLADPIGVFDFSDVTAFLGAFGAGCP
ncbi:MAG: GC-type dockerin domain-anchored protein [Phycisphaerales bacterium JB059]